MSKIDLRAIRERLHRLGKDSDLCGVDQLLLDQDALMDTDLPALLSLTERMARLLSDLANEAYWCGPVQRRADVIEALLSEVEGWEGGEDDSL